jgi:uncharacterized membrane protein YccC
VVTRHTTPQPEPGSERATGKTRRRAALRMVRARLAARDPGWRRARRAIGSTAGAAGSLAINAPIASAASQPTGVALLGAVVAMFCGLSVIDDERREQALTFALLPFMAAASVALGAALSTHRFVADAVFVVVVFAAISLRRRGPRWSAAGFVAFMTYFFSQFLHATPSQVPWLALAATIGVAVAAVIRLLVLPERPDRTLRHLIQALEGQAAAMLDAAVDVLESPRVPNRLRRRALAASGDLNRVALLVEEQLGVAPDSEKPALPGSAGLRDRVFMLEVAAAHTVSAVRAAVREGLPAPERADLATELRAVSRAIRSGRSPAALRRYARSGGAGEHGAEERAAAGANPYRGALHVRRALADLAEAAAELQRGGRETEPLAMWEGAGHEEPTDSPNADPYLGVKQGLQATVAVACAIIVGESLSATRWYWAAIAAYVVFVGADTRGATLRRATARIVGTFGGLIGGLVLAALVSGSKPVALGLIFVLMFIAWWIQPVSFLASTVAVTSVLALLYVLLGTFSRHLLLLRLEETGLGALLGGLAALLLVPARGSPVVREAEADVLDRIADLLRAVRSGGSAGAGTALRAVDSAFQRLRDISRPLSKGVPGAAARSMEQRIFALSAASYSARMLVSATLGAPDLGTELRRKLDALAERASKLAAGARAGVDGAGSGNAPDSELAPDPADGRDAAASGDPVRSDETRHRNRTHALVAVERLGIALTRWAAPSRAPIPPGSPATLPPEPPEPRDPLGSGRLRRRRSGRRPLVRGSAARQ